MQLLNCNLPWIFCFREYDSKISNLPSGAIEYTVKSLWISPLALVTQMKKKIHV